MNTSRHLHIVHKIVAGSAHANELPPAPEGRPLERVWTLLNLEQLDQQGPEHMRSAFLEEYGHDWRIDKNGKLHYFSRQAPKGAEVEVVLDYETDAERKVRLEAVAPRFDPMTGKRLAP